MGLLSEQPRRPIEPWIVKIFKLLDEKKKEKKTKKELLDYISSLAPYMNIPDGHEQFIYELYALNYRKDGDYSQLDKENYVDPRSRKGKTISNPIAWKFSIAQLPFKGSNMRGFWEDDGKGGEQYVVTSYDWYPIYIFKDDKWYEITESYSSSTGRQMSNVNPSTWNRKLESTVFRLTKNEMEKLRRGVSHDLIMKGKFQDLKNQEKRLGDKAKYFRPYDWDFDTIFIKFRINSIDLDGPKPVVKIDVEDVNKTSKGKKIPTPENYTKGELGPITKEYVEKKIKDKARNLLKDYIGTRPYLDDESKFLIDFQFNHLREDPQSVESLDEQDDKENQDDRIKKIIKDVAETYTNKFITKTEVVVKQDKDSTEETYYILYPHFYVEGSWGPDLHFMRHDLAKFVEDITGFRVHSRSARVTPTDVV